MKSVAANSFLDSQKIGNKDPQKMNNDSQIFRSASLGQRLERTWDMPTLYKRTHLYRFSGNACMQFSVAFKRLANKTSKAIYRFPVKCGRLKIVVHCGHIPKLKRYSKHEHPNGWLIVGHAKETDNAYDWNIYIASDKRGFLKLCNLMKCGSYLAIDSRAQFSTGIFGDYAVDVEFDCSAIKRADCAAFVWLKRSQLSSNQFNFDNIIS